MQATGRFHGEAGEARAGNGVHPLRGGVLVPAPGDVRPAAAVRAAARFRLLDGVDDVGRERLHAHRLGRDAARRPAGGPVRSAAVLQLALLVCLVGAVGSALAPDIWTPIAFRAVAGVSGAFFPLSVSLVSNVMPRERMGSAVTSIAREVRVVSESKMRSGAGARSPGSPTSTGS